MAGIFKKLSDFDYQVTPFKAHKGYLYTGNKSESAIYVLEGYDIPFERFAPNSSETAYMSSTTDTSFSEPTNSMSNESDQYHYKRTVWNSVNQLYYRSATEPAKTSGPNRIKTFPFYGESLGEGGMRYQERFLGSSVAVISVPGETYGNKIKPGSVKLVDNDNNITLYDDKFGNLYDTDVNTGSAVSDTGLVGWWSFDEVDTYKNNFGNNLPTLTKVNDNSIKNISTIVSGSPSFVTATISSSAGVHFNGNSHIEGTGSDFPYNSYDKSLNIKAISYWFNGANGGDMIHLSSDKTFDTGSHSWRVGLEGGKVVYNTVIRSGSLIENTYSSSLSTNNSSYNSGLHHCVCQISDGLKEIYLDGALVASESIVITEQDWSRTKSGSSTIVDRFKDVQPHINKIEHFRLGNGYTGALDEVRFYNRNLNSDEISTLYNHPSGKNFVGNVFYSQGLMTITNREKRYRNSFRNPVSCSIRYKGDITIYEHQIVCHINKNEFAHTLNRSARPNWNDKNENLIPELTGSNFAPYITTIGLYDDNYNLLAVGKLAEPVQNKKDIAMSIVVRFDS